MTPFAEMTAAMNAAIVDFLADSEADFGAGVVVAGLFRQPPAEVFGMVSGNRPSFEALETALSSVATGAAVTIGGTSYVVAEQVTDQGMTKLTLEAV